MENEIKNYKKSFRELNKLPDNVISEIYIIPSKLYNGFWGKNGYRSYDFIVGDKEIIGWFHWEGDVIHLINDTPFEMNIDSGKDKFIRLFNTNGFEIKGINLSNLWIKTEKTNN